MYEQIAECGISFGRPIGRELHYHSTAIRGIGMTLDEVARGQPVDSVGHRSRCDERLLKQPTWRQFVGFAGTSEGDQDVELPGLEAVPGEGLTACPVQMARESGDAAEYLQWRDIKVGTFPMPCGDEFVHFVALDLGALTDHYDWTPSRSLTRFWMHCCCSAGVSEESAQFNTMSPK
jgi:hypothetical protein